MAETTLRLAPTEAAASIAARVRTIKACQTYIRETTARYDGLKAFTAAIEAQGLTQADLDKLAQE